LYGGVDINISTRLLQQLHMRRLKLLAATDQSNPLRNHRDRDHHGRWSLHRQPGVRHHGRPAGTSERQQRRDRISLNAAPEIKSERSKYGVDNPAALHAVVNVQSGRSARSAQVTSRAEDRRQKHITLSVDSKRLDISQRFVIEVGDPSIDLKLS
jgi:hypothetical protein